MANAQRRGGRLHQWCAGSPPGFQAFGGRRQQLTGISLGNSPKVRLHRYSGITCMYLTKRLTICIKAFLQPKFWPNGSWLCKSDSSSTNSWSRCWVLFPQTQGTPVSRRHSMKECYVLWMSLSDWICHQENGVISLSIYETVGSFGSSPSLYLQSRAWILASPLGAAAIFTTILLTWQTQKINIYSLMFLFSIKYFEECKPSPKLLSDFSSWSNANQD